MSTIQTELAVKQLELVRELVPGISRVLVLAYPADPISPLQVKALERSAPAMGITLQVNNIQTAEDISAAFDLGVREGAQALLVTSTSIFLVTALGSLNLPRVTSCPRSIPGCFPSRTRAG